MVGATKPAGGVTPVKVVPPLAILLTVVERVLSDGGLMVCGPPAASVTLTDPMAAKFPLFKKFFAMAAAMVVESTPASAAFLESAARTIAYCPLTPVVMVPTVLSGGVRTSGIPSAFATE